MVSGIAAELAQRVGQRSRRRRRGAPATRAGSCPPAHSSPETPSRSGRPPRRRSRPPRPRRAARGSRSTSAIAAQDAERAVVFARVAHGIEVRAEQERAGAVRGLAAADQVEGRVFAHVEAGLAHPAADQRVGARHRGRAKRAGQAAGLVVSSPAAQRRRRRRINCRDRCCRPRVNREAARDSARPRRARRNGSAPDREIRRRRSSAPTWKISSYSPAANEPRPAAARRCGRRRS